MNDICSGYLLCSINKRLAFFAVRLLSYHRSPPWSNVKGDCFVCSDFIYQ